MKTIFLLIVILTFFLSGCDTTETPPDDGNNQPDTTTQNFTFETYEFGDGFESSHFDDVWVFDENNIWVVGFLGSKDTIIDGQSIYNPNIIQWNGEKWKLLPFSGTSDGIAGIWALDSSHIYFASGGLRKYENGVFQRIQTNMGLTTGQRVEKLWGSGENNIWGVGPFGTIVHFDGTNWSKIDFDTGWRIDDVTGDKSTGIAYAVATDISFNTAIIELNNSSAEIIYNSLNSELKLTGFNIQYAGEGKLVLSNVVIWQFDIEERTSKVLYNFKGKDGYFIAISALAAPNDIYFWGSKLSAGQIMVHYNGIRFKEVTVENQLGVIYGGMSAVNNLAASANFENNKAAITLIRRVN